MLLYPALSCYLLKVSAAGTVSGNVQHCSDTMRFVSQDIHEMSGMFFALGLRDGYRGGSSASASSTSSSQRRTPRRFSRKG